MCVSLQQIHIYDACEGQFLSRVTVGHCVGGTLAQVLSSCFPLGGGTPLCLLMDRCDYMGIRLGCCTLNKLISCRLYIWFGFVMPAF